MPEVDGVCFWRQLGRGVLLGGCCVMLRRLFLLWLWPLLWTWYFSV